MKVKVGDTVTVREWSGNTKQVVVEAVLKDVKNGRPGIDYVDNNAESEWDKRGWCYSNQILNVVG
jgi:hypothetical protein